MIYTLSSIEALHLLPRSTPLLLLLCSLEAVRDVDLILVRLRKLSTLHLNSPSQLSISTLHLNSPSQLCRITSASEVGHAASLVLPYLEHQAAQWPAGLVSEGASYLQS